MKSFSPCLAAFLILVPALASAMDVKAKSAIIIDAASGKVLWSRDADRSMFPASTTKIMTGLLLLERCLPSDIITAPADITAVKESSMHLKPFEQVSAKDMLYALMLRSANDGCYAVAKHIAGSVPAFAQMMNERARQIGCTNTHFNNPNGLNDPLHTTTAHDLALIAREAMKYDPFREVVKTQKYTINRSVNWKDVHMVNRDKWLKKDATAEGIKTGYTIPAGHCFVGAATRNGFRVITVVLKSENWITDTQQMVDWAYKNFDKREEIKAGDPVGEIQIDGSKVPVLAKSDSCIVVRKGSSFDKQLEAKASAPIVKGQVVGDLVFRDTDGFEQRIPVVSDKSVALSAVAALSKGSINPWSLAFCGVLFGGAFWVRGRARRMVFRTVSR